MDSPYLIPSRRQEHSLAVLTSLFIPNLCLNESDLFHLSISPTRSDIVIHLSAAVASDHFLPADRTLVCNRHSAVFLCAEESSEASGRL